MKQLKRNKAGAIRQIRISHIAATALDKHLREVMKRTGLTMFPRQFVSEAIMKHIANTQPGI